MFSSALLCWLDSYWDLVLWYHRLKVEQALISACKTTDKSLFERCVPQCCTSSKVVFVSFLSNTKYFTKAALRFSGEILAKLSLSYKEWVIQATCMAICHEHLGTESWFNEFEMMWCFQNFSSRAILTMNLNCLPPSPQWDFVLKSDRHRRVFVSILYQISLFTEF